MELSECARDERLFHVLLVDVVDIAPSTAKVESEVPPGFLFGSQHLGYVVSIVSIRERAPHRHSSSTGPGLNQIGYCLEMVKFRSSDGRHSPFSRLRLLHYWNQELGLELWECDTRAMINN